MVVAEESVPQNFVDGCPDPSLRLPPGRGEGADGVHWTVHSCICGSIESISPPRRRRRRPVPVYYSLLSRNVIIASEQSP